VALSVGLWRQDSPARPVAPRSEIQWIDRVRWVGLAAIPSSLLLGVTSYVTTDIGSAPFLWIGPLVLYLLTFVLAFRTPAFWPRTILAIQAFTAIAACALSRPMPLAFLFGGAVHFANFFFTALVAHQALMARRPAPGRLTEFYVWLSVGGVLGGAFNAFVAPVAFDTLVEYPAVLVLSCLVRPWNSARPAKAWPVALFLLCGLTMAAAAWLAHPAPARLAERVSALGAGKQAFIGILVMAAAAMAFGLRNRSPLFALAALVVVVGAGRVAAPADVVSHWRGFYGVLRESRVWEPGLGGEVRKLAHGSTLHGVEAVSPAYRCQPLLYYAHETPIGQVFDAEARIKPSLNVGAVGLGAGTVAAYERPEDHFTFFEIDPLVVKIAKDSGRFSYLNGCAKGRVDQVIGDARWSLARQADKRFDILLIDAFSSDSVPAHLLTVEAVHLYLSKIKPDGVVILHLSNRNLDLMNPAQAVARINGAFALTQRHIANPQLPPFWESSEDAVVLAPTPQGLAPFVADPRWQAPDDHNVAPWTDDHTDIFGALLRRLGTTRRE
jgi:predicted O-methyltransferase YrrM